MFHNLGRFSAHRRGGSWRDSGLDRVPQRVDGISCWGLFRRRESHDHDFRPWCSVELTKRRWLCPEVSRIESWPRLEFSALATPRGPGPVCTLSLARLVAGVGFSIVFVPHSKQAFVSSRRRWPDAGFKSECGAEPVKIRPPGTKRFQLKVHLGITG